MLQKDKRSIQSELFTFLQHLILTDPFITTYKINYNLRITHVYGNS